MDACDASAMNLKNGGGRTAKDAEMQEEKNEKRERE